MNIFKRAAWITLSLLIFCICSPRGAEAALPTPSTNYWLQIATNGLGSVVLTNGVSYVDAWQGHGSTVTVVAVPASSDQRFLRWSGHTNGCTISTTQIVVRMTSARSISANFTNAYQRLLIATNGMHWGTPRFGVETNYAYGSTVTARVTNATFRLGTNTTQYVVTGYSISNSNGSVTTGSGTNVTFVITNSATLTWLYQTNYYLTIAKTPAATCGVVNVTNGWKVAGTQLVITATGSNHYEFSAWSGATNGCTISNNTITVPMDGPRVITNRYTIGTNSLTIVTPYGSGSPAAGTNWYTYNTQLVARISGSPVTNGATQYVCYGWTRTGSVPRNSLTTTNMTAFRLTNNATVTWLWRTNYWLDVRGSNGTVSLTNSWRGTSVVVRATASNNYQFGSWSGDTNGCAITGNQITVVMDGPRTIRAECTPTNKNLIVVSRHGTPDPVVGTHPTIFQTTVNASITDSPVLNGTTQYVCRGYRRTGSSNSNNYVGATNMSFTLTNNTTVTWLWRTNYWLDTTANLGGTVNVDDNWYVVGTSTQITATALSGFRFTGWSGDTAGCAILGNKITAVMTRPRAIAASFVSTVTNMPPLILRITTPYGSGTPDAETFLPYPYNSYPEAMITNSPVNVGNTQYQCVGWTRTGIAPFSGTGTNVGFYITNHCELSWQWVTNYWLDIEANGAGGSIDVPSGWYLLGSNVAAAAIPDYGYSFVSWSGDTNGCTIDTNTITAPITTTPRQIRANFSTNGFTLTIASPTVGAGYITRAVPAVGVYGTNYAANITVAVTNSPIYVGKMATAKTQYFCKGWAGTGSAGSGTETNTSFVLTNSSTVTWIWSTNYAMTLTNKTVVGGTVDAVSRWQEIGSNVVITAYPSNNWHLAAWRGNTNNCTFSNNTITVPVSGVVTLSVSFAKDQYTLTTVTPRGTTVPATTQTTNFDVQVRSVLRTPSITNGWTNYVSTGWVVEGATNGTDATTNTGYFALSTNTTVAWLWQTNYWLDTAGAGGSTGSVDVSDQWVAADGEVVITATASSHWVFASWSGATSGCDIVGNVITVRMTQARQIVANFTRDQHTLTIDPVYGSGYPDSNTWTAIHGSNVVAIMYSPVTIGATQYVCTGWTGTGGVTNGTGTNMTLVITNDATLTWLWRTNHYLNSGVYGNGRVTGATDGWYVVTSTQMLTAVSTGQHSFVSWSGMTNDCTISTNTIRVPMTQYRRIVANFDVNQVRLTITNSLTGGASTNGAGSPAPGANDYYYGAIVTAVITNSPVVDGGTTNWCIGWTGTGSAPLSGDSTNTGPFVLATNSTITWIWSTVRPLASKAISVPIMSVSLDAQGGRVITWASEGGAYYSVLRSIELMAGDTGFQVLPGAKAIEGVPPQNSFTDAEELLGPVFYRVIQVDNPYL